MLPHPYSARLASSFLLCFAAACGTSSTSRPSEAHEVLDNARLAARSSSNVVAPVGLPPVRPYRQWNESQFPFPLPVPADEIDAVVFEFEGGILAGFATYNGRPVYIDLRNPSARSRLDEVTGPVTFQVGDEMSDALIRELEALGVPYGLSAPSDGYAPEGLMHVQMLNIDSTTPELRGYRRLRELHVRGYIDFEDLRGLENLEVLHISSLSSVTNVEALSTLTDLRDLELPLELSGEDYSHLAGLVSLERLVLATDTVTDDIVASLRPLRNLRSLALSHTAITDVSMGVIRSFEGLESLDLGGSPITNVGLQQLAGFGSLRHLRLSRTQITGEGLATLETLPQLEDLDLSEISLRGGLPHLAPLVRLKRLTLSNALHTSAEDFGVLGGMHELVSLDLTRMNGFSDVHLARLRAPRLRNLELRETHITSDGLRQSAQHFPALQQLSLYYCYNDIQDLEFVRQLPALRSLDITRTRVPAEALSVLANAQELRVLQLGEDPDHPIPLEAADTILAIPRLRSVSPFGGDGFYPRVSRPLDARTHGPVRLVVDTFRDRWRTRH